MTKVTAKLSSLRMSPKKVRLVADFVRGKGALQAQSQLNFLQKKAAEPVRKLLESAMANAKHNHSLSQDSLKIAEIRVDEGPTMKRFRPRAFGRAGAIRKRSSHIKLVLEGDIDEKLLKENQERIEKPKQEEMEKDEEKKVEEKPKEEKKVEKKTEKKVKAKK